MIKLLEKRGFALNAAAWRKLEAVDRSQLALAAKDVKLLATKLGMVEFNHYKRNLNLNLNRVPHVR